MYKIGLITIKETRTEADLRTEIYIEAIEHAGVLVEPDGARGRRFT